VQENIYSVYVLSVSNSYSFLKGGRPWLYHISVYMCA